MQCYEIELSFLYGLGDILRISLGYLEDLFGISARALACGEMSACFGWKCLQLAAACRLRLLGQQLTQ